MLFPDHIPWSVTALAGRPHKNVRPGRTVGAVEGRLPRRQLASQDQAGFPVPGRDGPQWNPVTSGGVGRVAVTWEL